MHVYWLQQSEADMLFGDDWLSASELSRLGGMRVPKRRADWRLGRWTAKLALAAYLNGVSGSTLSDNAADLRSIEVHPQASGAPKALVWGEPIDNVISLTHTSGLAMCAVATASVRLGCDMEQIEERSGAFVSDYFTTEEQTLISQAPVRERALLVTLMWSAKESALKALGEGLRLDTKSVAVTLATPSPAVPLPDGTWNALHVVSDGGTTFHGWWQADGPIVRTLVADPAPDRPIEMKAAAEVLYPTLVSDNSCKS
jgi:4'-phosphopantetheinyl transferase